MNHNFLCPVDVGSCKYKPLLLILDSKFWLWFWYYHALNFIGIIKYLTCDTSVKESQIKGIDGAPCMKCDYWLDIEIT